MEPRNFINVYLGDNDFSNDIMNALNYGYEMGYHETLTPILWRRFIINFIIGEVLRKEYHFKNGKAKIHEVVEHILTYLDKHLSVTFEMKIYDEDWQEGGARLDVNTGIAWTY